MHVTKTYEEKFKPKLYENTSCSFEQIREVILLKMAVVWPHTNQRILFLSLYTYILLV